MIKNIIFDFGGVLYNLDFKKTIDAFGLLGFSDFESMFSQFQANSLFQDLETGKISEDEFYKTIQLAAPNPITIQQIRDAWNALLLGYRTDSIEHLSLLNKQYNLFLLSNTNKIHHDYFSAQLMETTNQSSLDNYFTKAYYSHQIGLRKPNEDIFEFVIKDSGINAAETIFIDDTFSNLPPAESLGMKTILLNPGKLIEEIDFSAY